jgi:exodeoxyribonuclease-3
VRLPQVLTWLAAEQPDVLALQETKLVDEKFPRAEIEAAGYRSVYAGQKTYNGVALLSRVPAQDVVSGIPGYDDVQRRVLAATFDGVRVIDLYVPNGESVESDKYRYKLNWLEALTAWVKQELATYSQLIILGDFNIAPESRATCVFHHPSHRLRSGEMTGSARPAPLTCPTAVPVHDDREVLRNDPTRRLAADR